MKFLCPNCKAKYQISDEKIAGRTLKMDCRRCNHAIVIRGDRLTGSGAAARPQAPAAPAQQSSRSALGADFRRAPAPMQAPATPGALDAWHAAINDVPVGPLSQDELSKKIAAGAVDERSLVWREGLEDWRPLAEVPELVAFLREMRKPKVSARPAAPARRPRPSAPRPPPPGSRASAPRRPGPRSAAPRPAAPRPAARAGVSARGAASAAAALDGLNDFDQDDEPTRVGSAIDFEALERERQVEDARREQSNPGAVAAPPPPEALSAPVKPPASPPRAKLAPAPPAKPVDTPPPSPPSSPGLVGSAGATGPAAGSVGGQGTPSPFASPSGSASGVPLADPSPPASDPGQDDAFDPFFAASAPGDDDRGAVPMPVAAAAGAAGSSPAAVPVASEGQLAVPAERRRRGLPIGAWIAIAGAMAFGVALAVIVGQKLILEPDPQPVAVAPPPEEPAVDPEGPLEIPPVEEETDPESEATADGEGEEGADGEGAEGTGDGETPESAGGATGRRAGSGGATSPRPTTPGTNTPTTPTPSGRRGTLSPEAQARFDRAAGGSTGSGMATVQERAGVLDERQQNTGGGLSGDQIRAVVARERAGVQRCYESAARRTGQAPSTRLDVDITVGGSGTVTAARVRGTAFADLSTCVQRTVLRWRFPATGGVSRTSIPFVFSGRD